MKHIAKTETYLSILLLFKLTLKLIGDHITQTYYKAKDGDEFRVVKLKCDLYLLRLLCRPTTVYDVIKKLNYAHSTAYNRLQGYLHQGIIQEVKSERLPSGLVKRHYRISEVGLSLLEVVEKISDNYENTE